MLLDTLATEIVDLICGYLDGQSYLYFCAVDTRRKSIFRPARFLALSDVNIVYQKLMRHLERKPRNFGRTLELILREMWETKIDPAAMNNYAVRWAAKNGFDTLILYLLQDNRVNPSVMLGTSCNNYFSIGIVPKTLQE